MLGPPDPPVPHLQPAPSVRSTRRTPAPTQPHTNTDTHKYTHLHTTTQGHSSTHTTEHTHTDLLAYKQTHETVGPHPHDGNTSTRMKGVLSGDGGTYPETGNGLDRKREGPHHLPGDLNGTCMSP